ncbi:mitochondrial basic amino acids transporter-like [Paramacrobiotus metropolitanus]|uniref:mitochondrial basic amino acids transporter-like n=1 Tax=Paramacrobiotus metropolitanus TaxID=2943436 RepID=UPI0024456F95|nr:mitochondrial basic amino acids transporter-like [Paramacrobiotus metropolitanus]
MDPVLADFVAGTLGGCAGVIVGYPLDTVKVRLQTQSAAAPLYKGTYHCLSTIVRNESAWGLYKGMSSPLCGVAVINAIVFGVYGNAMRYLNNNASLTNHFLAGMLAGGVQSLISCPMELAKTKIQIQGILGPDPMEAIKSGFAAHQKPPLYKSPSDCLWQLYRQRGLRAVYRGFNATLSRELPGFGTYFFAYEYLVRLMTPPSEEPGGPPGEIGIGRLLLAGGLSGIISWLVSFPQDVVKSRFQADDQYRSATHCALLSYREEGLRVFGRGLWSTVLRAFPTNAATLTVVTLFLRYVSQLNDDKHLQEIFL